MKDNNQQQINENLNEALEQTTQENQQTSPSNKIKNEIKDSPSSKPVAFKKQVSPSGFEEKVVQIKRISKTTKGGRHMRFSALVVIGNKNGQVGFGMGKSIEVPDAIRKALKNANNNIFNVRMNKNGTVFHENIGKHGASRVLVKPAPKGTGIIAGGPVRAVVELAGYNDIYTKSLGSSTPINVIRGTVKALSEQYTPSEIASLRDKNISQL